MKLAAVHAKVLSFLAEEYEPGENCFYTFAGIAANTRLDVKQIRRSCRFLARKGLAKYQRGLWTEDGEPFGSGYAATKAGVELAVDQQL